MSITSGSDLLVAGSWVSLLENKVALVAPEDSPENIQGFDDAKAAPEDGGCLFDSARHTGLPSQKRQAEYLFQQYALFPNVTVQQNIAVVMQDKAKRKETLPALMLFAQPM